MHTAGAETLLRPAFGLICLYSFSTGLASAALLPVLPLYVRGPVDGGDVAVGVVMSGGLLVAALAQPSLGRLADHRGTRLLLVGGPLVFGSFVALFPFAGSPGGLFWLRALAGVGDAACMVGALTVVNDLAPDERRGEAYSIFSLSIWAGLGLGPVVGDLVHRTHSFEAVWHVSIGLSLAGAVAALLLPETRLSRTTERPPFSVFSRWAAIPGVVMALEMFGFAALVVFTPLYARELGMGGAGLVLFVNAAVLVSLRVLGRRLPDRVGAKRSATVGVTLAALGLALPALVARPGGLYAGAAVFGAGHALLYPALFLLAVNRATKEERSAALGSLKACEGLGFAGGATLLGVVASLSGYGMVFAVAALATITGLLPLRLLAARSERKFDD